jgi:twitching motility protein PilT
LQLSTIIKAVISQRLVPRADGKGRVPALEILISTALTRELIADKDRTKELPEHIAKGHSAYGMQTFDQSLMSHVRSGLVSYDEALKHVSNPDDFALRFRGIASTSDSEWNEFSDDDDNAEDQKPENDGVDGLMDGDDFNIDRF